MFQQKVVAQGNDLANPKASRLQKQFWGLSLPIMIEFLIGFSVPVVDSFFLAQISIEAALAVGAVLPILVFCDVFYGSLNSSAKSLAAQALGSGDAVLAKRIFNHTLLFVLVISTLQFTIFYFFSKQIVQLLALPPHIAAIANDYLIVMGCGYGVLGSRYLFQVMNALYGIVKFNIGAAAIMLGVNIIGDAAVVYNWFGLGRFGVVGVAIVSILAVLAALIYLIIVQKMKLGFTLKLIAPRKDFVKIAKLSTVIAIPSVLEPMSVQLFLMTITSVVASLGQTELAMRIFGANLFLLCIVPGLAFTVTSQILAGNFLGAKDFTTAEQLIYITLRYSVAMVSVMALVIVLFGQPLLSLFTSDVAILSIALACLIPLALAEPLKSVNMVIGSNLKSAGDGLRPTIVGIVLTWLITIPLVWYVAPQYGLLAILWLLLLDEFLKCGYNLLRWSQGIWRTNLIDGLKEEK